MEAETLNVTKGKKITFKNIEYLIIGRLDMDSILVRTLDGKLTQKLSISEVLQEIPAIKKSASRIFASLESIDEFRWQDALGKRDAVKRAFEDGESPSKVAQEMGMHVTTLYDLRLRFETYGLESLVKQPPNGGTGKSRLTKSQEDIIVEAIKDEYLTGQRKCVAEVYDEVKLRCHMAKIKAPSRNTIYRRCSAIDQQIKEKKRNGSKAAKDKFAQTMDGYQEATRPLEIVQIDHTLMDIIILDDETRLPIGRPWLTIAIDVYSRMVYGFVISLDPPSAMSSALCLQQAICKKEPWLAARDICHSWGIYGLLEALHMDNGKDFHSKTLKRGCDKHGIDMLYRPVGKAEYGAHVERLIGTFMKKMKILPGATFSNVNEKGDYDSEGKAVMTLAEVEKWFATLVTGSYHKKKHSSLHMSPEDKFIEGIQGIGNTPGAGINRIVMNESDLLMDFTPYFEKTVQNYGIQLDSIRYNCEELKKFLHVVSPKTGNKRKFIVRRDPRDISVVYFFDPDEKCYITVPYKNQSRPVISLFEHRMALNALKERGKTDKVTEEEIFRTHTELKAIEEQATNETKKARRNRQRRKLHRISSGYDKPHTKPTVDDFEYEEDDDDVVPFDEVEMA